MNKQKIKEFKKLIKEVDKLSYEEFQWSGVIVIIARDEKENISTSLTIPYIEIEKTINLKLFTIHIIETLAVNLAKAVINKKYGREFK